MNIKKTLLVAGAVMTVGGLGAAGVGVASVAASPGEGDLIQKIADKMNLSNGQVQGVLKEAKLARMEERQKSIDQQLNELVQEGKITTEQKAKLLAKQIELNAEIKAEFEAIKSMPKDDARHFVKDRREELKAWAEANGINEKFVQLIANFPIMGVVKVSSEMNEGVVGAEPEMHAVFESGSKPSSDTLKWYVDQAN